MRAVSPRITLTRSSGSRRTSAATWASVVRMPWPISMIPVATVARPDGRQVRLPAVYVADHVSLGYCTTIHGAQGQTVDSCHLVTSGGGDVQRFQGVCNGQALRRNSEAGSQV